jgi:DNA mismatch repair protein MutS
MEVGVGYKVPIKKLEIESKFTAKEIIEGMKRKGYVYNKDLRGMDKDGNGNYYKGGFEGVRKIMVDKNDAIIKEQEPEPEPELKKQKIATLTKTITAIPFLSSSSNLFFLKHSSNLESIHETELDNLCFQTTAAKQSMKLLLGKKFKEFLDVFIDKFYTLLNDINSFLIDVDILFCKATVSKENGYCKPKIVGKNDQTSYSYIDAKGLRHCLVESLLSKKEIFVSNDVSLGNEPTGILLFGTNQVGKTILIKSLGIALIMAQAGMYVPCTEFTFYPFQYLFTRILGNDNFQQGLSTFAVEMTELRTILSLANANSLVLGDELCSGTETISATSIFAAGILQLKQLGVRFFFATHFHEITSYEELRELAPCVQFQHMQVIYDKENDCLVYHRKLKPGAGHCFYGLEVCKSLHLPASFLSLANSLRMKYHPETQSMLNLKTSHYNSNKLMAICEKCGVRPSTEVHHIIPQRKSDKNGQVPMEGEIRTFHKNTLTNLQSLCETCHRESHS